MGKQKARTTTTATFEDRKHSATADEATARNTVANADFSTPIVGAFGQAEKALNNQYYEEDLPEGVESQVRAGRLFDLNMQKAGALSAAKSQEHQAKSGGQLALAGMTQDKTLQTGGTNYNESWGTGVYNPGVQMAMNAGMGML